MKTNYKVAIALVAGAAIGGAAIQGLHAQAKPPAYVVIPILKMNHAAAFKAGVIDKATDAAMAAVGGHYVIRTQKFTRLDGNPPGTLGHNRIDSVEKAQAWENAPAVKEVTAARMKSTNSLSFIVQATQSSLQPADQRKAHLRFSRAVASVGGLFRFVRPPQPSSNVTCRNATIPSPSGDKRTCRDRRESVARDPTRKWSVHRSAPTYALGQHH